MFDIILNSYINVPNAGIVVERGIDLANLFDVAPVPYVQTVIIVDTSQLE